MIKISNICLALMLILTTNLFAAEYSTNVSGIVSKMRADLNLTEEQVVAIKPIIKANLIKRQKYLESIEEEAITNETAIKQRINQLKREENEQLKKVLTPEQMEKFLEKQHLKEKLNQDKINYKEFLQEGTTLTPQGGSFQF